MKKIKDNSLYFVTSEEYSAKRGTLEVAKRAFEGGIDILQMREKEKSEEELRTLGRELAFLCREQGVIFIVNDDPILAKELGADGVHLGQEDIKECPARKTREILGTDKIIGISTHSLGQFKEANEKDFDYIAFGPIFSTKTKNYSIGAGDVEKVLEISDKPVFFIGGINLSNLGSLLDKGARNIAVIRAIAEADDIVSRTKDIRRLLRPPSAGSQ